mmetsp:Transcript_34563/g.81935  ORF Transcript_34563/g.81935 Transcript_34563/m.81935 type:complete len:232 (-) Transcript_34563:317-1012(-)
MSMLRPRSVTCASAWRSLEALLASTARLWDLAISSSGSPVSASERSYTRNSCVGFGTFSSSSRVSLTVTMPQPMVCSRLVIISRISSGLFVLPRTALAVRPRTRGRSERGTAWKCSRKMRATGLLDGLLFLVAQQWWHSSTTRSAMSFMRRCRLLSARRTSSGVETRTRWLLRNLRHDVSDHRSTLFPPRSLLSPVRTSTLRRGLCPVVPMSEMTSACCTASTFVGQRKTM